MTLIGAAVTVLCFAVRNVTVLGFVTVLGVIGLIPMAQQGHAGAADARRRHHRLRAARAVRQLLARRPARRSSSCARCSAPADHGRAPRYSTIALIGFMVVAASGQ